MRWAKKEGVKDVSPGLVEMAETARSGISSAAVSLIMAEPAWVEPGNPCRLFERIARL